jgi:phenylalanyl-tRNA synthetase beta chain
VSLMLPLSSAESRLRRAVLPALLHRVEYNYTRGTRDIRLFELGTAFLPGGEDAPSESTRLSIVLTGARTPVHWSGKPADYDVWDLKGIAEEVAALLGFTLRPREETDTIAGVSALLAGGAAFTLLDGGVVVGQAGQIRGDKVDAPAWAAPAFGLEVVLNAKHARPDRPYRELPALPGIEVDLALVVPDSVSAERVEATLRQSGGALLEHIAVFDEYRGKGIPERTRSIAYRLRFRAADRTLTDADVRTIVGRILKRLKDEHGIERR